MKSGNDSFIYCFCHESKECMNIDMNRKVPIAYIIKHNFINFSILNLKVVFIYYYIFLNLLP